MVDGLTLDGSIVGKFIEVKFDPLTFVETAPGSGNWTATAFKLELEDERIQECGTSEGNEAEIEGVITRGLGDDNGTPGDPSDDLSSDQFEINGASIVQLDATLAADSSATALIMVGHEVKVEGAYDANGVLVVNEVKSETTGNLEHKGIVTGIVERNTGIPLTGSNYDVSTTYLVTLDGGTASEQTFVLNPLEAFMDDNSDVYGKAFKLTHLLTGSPNVEIHYYIAGTDKITTKLGLE